MLLPQERPPAPVQSKEGGLEPGRAKYRYRLAPFWAAFIMKAGVKTATRMELRVRALQFLNL